MFCALPGTSVGLCELYNKHMPVLGIDRTSFNTHGRRTANKYHKRGTTLRLCALPGTSVGLCYTISTCLCWELTGLHSTHTEEGLQVSITLEEH